MGHVKVVNQQIAACSDSPHNDEPGHEYVVTCKQKVYVHHMLFLLQDNPFLITLVGTRSYLLTSSSVMLHHT